MAEVKKIIIDEDWKSQVQAEKEEAAKATSSSTTAADKEAEPAEAGDPQMPPGWTMHRSASYNFKASWPFWPAIAQA